MIRVQTLYKGDAMLFIQRNGTKATHPYKFTHRGVDYYLLGGVYYDLPQDVIDRIFN